MVSFMIVVVVMACASWMAWSRWTYWRTAMRPRPAAEKAPQTNVFEAFARGNTCLAAGRFAEAIAAFEEARWIPNAPMWPTYSPKRNGGKPPRGRPPPAPQPEPVAGAEASRPAHIGSTSPFARRTTDVETEARGTAVPTAL